MITVSDPTARRAHEHALRRSGKVPDELTVLQEAHERRRVEAGILCRKHKDIVNAIDLGEEIHLLQIAARDAEGRGDIVAAIAMTVSITRMKKLIRL